MTIKKNIVLILASMGTFVEALDIAIINLTIPSIQSQFNVDNDTVQWLQTLYVLCFGGFIIIGGKLSDSIGRKKVFIVGSLIFLLSSLGAGVSDRFEFLAICRAIQGLGAALIMPSALSLVTHTFTEPRERSRAIGIFSSFAAIGSGSGLSFGGIISTYWSWHWVFLINVPILLLVIISATIFLDKDVKSQKNEKPDILTAILLIAAPLLLTYGIHSLTEFAEHPMRIIVSLTTSAVLLFTLYHRLKKSATPLLDLELFKVKSLMVSNMAFFLLGAFFIGFLFLISIMFQKDMGLSAATSGLLLVPFSILSALVAKFALPQILKVLDSQRLGILGMGFMLTGGILLSISIVSQHPLGLILLAAACISGVGMTLCFTSLSVLSITDVDPQHYGMASSLTSTTYFLGAGIGLSILTLIMKIFPSAYSVSLLSTSVLSTYGLLGLLLMVYNVKSRKQVSDLALKSE